MSNSTPSRPRPVRGVGSSHLPSGPPRRPGTSPLPDPPHRRRRVVTGILLAVAALVIVLVVVLVALPSGHSTSTATASTPAGSTGPEGPEGIPLETGTVLAPGSTPAMGATVDGVQCNSSEQVAYHVHTHLAIYVDGKERALPAGVGIVQPVTQQTPDGPFDGASQCYYWLHVHTRDGVIHIESPTAATYALGQFFDIWGQPLTTDRVGPATGPLTIYVDGKRFRGDPRSIVLGSHVDIQIDVGTPAPSPKQVDWSRSEL
jgi:hypothetical protein